MVAGVHGKKKENVQRNVGVALLFLKDIVILQHPNIVVKAVREILLKTNPVTHMSVSKAYEVMMWNKNVDFWVW